MLRGLAITVTVLVAAPGAAQVPPTPGPSQTVSIVAGSASGRRGEQVTIAVTLDTMGRAVAGVQNDLSFYPTVVALGGCTVNPELGKELSIVRPSGGGVRAIIFGFNTAPIPDGATLYTCTFDILPTATPGSYRLFNSHVGASSPLGQALPAVGIEGTIVVIPPPTRTPAPTPTLIPNIASISAGVVRGEPGQQVTFTVSLHTAGASVAGTQNDIFDTAQTPIHAKPDGEPDCTVGPTLNKIGVFAFRPADCDAGTCLVLRAFVFALTDTSPIADGAILYSCNVDVRSDTAAGVYGLLVSNFVLSSPAGRMVPVVKHDGAVVVGDVALPIPGFGLPPPPNLAPPVSGAAPAAPASSTGGGGCAISPESRLSFAELLLLIPLLVLCLRRTVVRCRGVWGNYSHRRTRA